MATQAVATYPSTEQASLFDVEPVAVRRPKTLREQAAAARPHWFSHTGAHLQCGHCVQIAAEAHGTDQPVPSIRAARYRRTVGTCTTICRENLRRLGVGCEHHVFLCSSHAQLQRRADGLDPLKEA